MISVQRRKSKIALLIRVVLLLSVTLICGLVILFTGTKNNEDVVKFRAQRKILNVVDAVDEYDESNEDRYYPRESNCTPASILDFPSDGLSRAQRRNGWILLHVIAVCYLFWALAIICDDYFVPTIKLMCKKFRMREDVAGATFMAAATSSPELFINIVGTFITEGDIGVGTIVGSAVFNILAVPACCGLLGAQIFQLDWYPISRDCLMYGISVFALFGTLYDSRVMWYEAGMLVCLYVFYILSMYCNDWTSGKMKIFVGFLNGKENGNVNGTYQEVTEITCLLPNNCKPGIEIVVNVEEDLVSDEVVEIVENPYFRGDLSLFMYILRWPITFLLYYTVADIARHPRLRFFSFFTCIVWIGASSYMTTFLITVIGDTMNIPDSVMGLTLLAAGTSVPEAVSSVIVTKQGFGEMGISNSIGSNTFDILLCLGLPWLLKSSFFPVVPEHHWVTINSSGLSYSVISLMVTLLGLYLAFAMNKFRMDYKIGITCTIMYISFLVFASLIELNVFFAVNLPTCYH